MRIGIVAPPWLPVPPPAYGGTEGVIDLLALEWQAAGHEVVLCATGDSTCGVETRSLHRTARPDLMGASSHELSHVAFAYEALADCDIIHDHTLLGPLAAPPPPGWPKANGVPIVSTCHNEFTPQLVPAFRSIARRAAVVAISADQASRANGVPIRRVIHHGLDASRFPVGTGGGDFLLFLGRMAPSKGAHRAIEIARRTGQRLVIAAKCRSGEEVEYFNSSVRPLLGPDIDYVGEVGTIEKLELLGEARALLNPIRWPEPFGLVMIEAMACGTPVLTYAEGAAPEIVDHGRTGFVADDEDELVASIERIGELSRSACRRSVEGYFSASRMAAEYVRLFESVLDHGNHIDLARDARPIALVEASKSA